MDEAYWEPVPSDLKQYKHWDAVQPIDKIAEFVRDSDRVRQHSFRPLLHYTQSWRRAPIRHIDAKTGVVILEKRTPKERPIRYACRKDAYIYKHYREILSARYELELQSHGLNDSVLAYRRIPLSAGSSANKSNINFADDAFKAIDQLGKCCAVAVDIKSYFDRIDHDLLKERWSEILGVERLPDDHFRIFRSITDYRFVDRDEAFVALGYAHRDRRGHLRYTDKPTRIPMQLCSPSEYREKIVGGGLIQPNPHRFGIPQGTPISDLLANAFLLRFDIAMQRYAEKRGGVYYRYSDDILMIVPGDGRAASGIIQSIEKQLRNVGPSLKLSRKKTEIVCFTPQNGRQRCYGLVPQEGSEQRKRGLLDRGLSYLGFRYDGRSVYLRNSTITNLRGKISRACKAIAFAHVKRHGEKDLDWLLEHQPILEVRQKYLKVEDFREKASEAMSEGESSFEHLTFWSYVSRASDVFGDRGKHIARQVRKVDDHISRTLENEIARKFRLLRS